MLLLCHATVPESNPAHLAPFLVASPLSRQVRLRLEASGILIMDTPQVTTATRLRASDACTGPRAGQGSTRPWTSPPGAASCLPADWRALLAISAAKLACTDLYPDLALV